MGTGYSFDAEELLRSASESTGLVDFGPSDFREGLDALVQGLNTDAVIPPDRVPPLRNNILRLLKNRLWMQRDIDLHPEILDEELQSPIIISSLPRTGSTKLHRLLGASGDFQQLQYWKAHLFARPTDALGTASRQRIAETRAYEQWVYQVCPTMITGHPMFTDEPEEEFHLLQASFRTISAGLFGSESHNAWLASSDPTPGYDYLQTQLKYLQWQFGEGRGKPWILKSPVHYGLEDQLVRIFQDPRFIVTHRDPAQVVPSAVNITQNWTVVYAEPAPNASVGRDMLQMCAAQADQHLAWRVRNPDLRVVDVAFSEINKDDLSLITRIYEELDLLLTDDAKSNMQRWIDENPRNKHGANKYSISETGITIQDIFASFQKYRERFSAYI